MSSNTFSFTQWYAVHGERLNEKRRDRYHTDPEYKKKVLQQNRESRRKRRAEERKNRPPKEPRQPGEHAWKTTKVRIEGKLQTAYTIGALADKLRCSIQAIRLWERQGLIPEAPFRTPNGDRLYTADSVKEIRAALKKAGRLSGESKRRDPNRPLLRYARFADGAVREVRLYLIGALALAVNRNVVTLEQMEARGALPGTPFKASRVGRRLYTKEMIEAVKATFDEQEEIRGEEAWKKFHDSVLARWTALHVMGASLIEQVPDKGTDRDVSEGARGA